MSRQDKTLLIPSGTLNGNVTNVVVIPGDVDANNQSMIVKPNNKSRNSSFPGAGGCKGRDATFPRNATSMDTDVYIPGQQPLNRSLVERAPALGGSQVIYGERSQIRPAVPRCAVSLKSSADGSSFLPDFCPNFNESDYGLPIAQSTFRSYFDEDDLEMYDSSLDAFVGGSSGDLSGSALQAILGGQYNRIEEPQRQSCLCSTMEDSSLTNTFATAFDTTWQSSHYTPFSVPNAEYSGFYDEHPEFIPVPNCGPCYPSSWDNCPSTCPMQRGIPFGDLNVSGDFFPVFDESGQIDANVTCDRDGSGYLTRTRDTPPPDFGVTGPALNSTRCLNTTGPALNRTRPCPNVTRPIQNVTRPALNVTRPVLNTTGPALNRTRPIGGQSCLNQTRPGLNVTGPSLNRTGSKINISLSFDIDQSELMDSSISSTKSAPAGGSPCENFYMNSTI